MAGPITSPAITTTTLPSRHRIGKQVDYNTYDRQHHLFPELPEQLPIVIGITAYGKCIGLSRTTWTHGPRITIASNRFWRGRHFVDDIMCHEMLHCWLYLTGQDVDHKSEAWYAAIRRLSPEVLGHEL